MQTMPPLLIVTRPHATGEAFAEKVQAQFGPVDVILSPGLKIVPLAVPVPANLAHVIFTSANGVAQASRLGVPLDTHAWCVGNRTAEAAQALGYTVTIGGGDAIQLIETVKESRPKGKIVHVTGQHRQGGVAATLRRSGLDCEELIAYDQTVCAPTPDLQKALLGDRPLVIPLFSARSSLTFLGIEWCAPVHIVAISPAVAEVATEWHVDTVACAKKPDELAMVEETCRVLDRLNLGSSVA